MIFTWSYRYPELVHLVWIAIAIVVALAVLELRSRGALAVFLSPVMQKRLTAQASTSRVVLRLGLVLLALLAAVGALMRPQARGETETVDAASPSADVVFVLDVSRSMLAEDTAPNRFVRAKAEIAQLLVRLEGQRVGLVAFAGRAVQVCPLTPDHSFFSTVLASIDTRSAGKGGTRIGEAIKVAVRGFPDGAGSAKLIILITDGDDQDPYSEEAAKLARDASVKIVAVGLGSEEGSTITITVPETGAKQTLEHEGKPVISKLNGEQLRKVALVSEGVYIPAGTSALDLDSIVDGYITPLIREAEAKAVRRIPVEKFAWFVLASLMFLLAALWVGAGAGDRSNR